MLKNSDDSDGKKGKRGLFWRQSKVLNLRVSRSLHTHTPPEGGVSQMVAYRLLQVEVPEDTKR